MLRCVRLLDHVRESLTTTATLDELRKTQASVRRLVGMVRGGPYSVSARRFAAEVEHEVHLLIQARGFMSDARTALGGTPSDQTLGSLWHRAGTLIKEIRSLDEHEEVVAELVSIRRQVGHMLQEQVQQYVKDLTEVLGDLRRARTVNELRRVRGVARKYADRIPEGGHGRPARRLANAIGDEARLRIRAMAAVSSWRETLAGNPDRLVLASVKDAAADLLGRLSSDDRTRDVAVEVRAVLDQVKLKLQKRPPSRRERPMSASALG